MMELCAEDQYRGRRCVCVCSLGAYICVWEGRRREGAAVRREAFQRLPCDWGRPRGCMCQLEGRMCKRVG